MADGYKTPQARYDATHTVQFKMKLNTKSDADILGRLAAVGNKQGYIKDLIRADILGAKTPATTPVKHDVDTTTDTDA